MRNQFGSWSATKVKAKFNYTCACCGATENIQAHDPTGEHKDWRVGIALCGKCHSKGHPDRPANLFTTKVFQPTWPNISARSLAKEIGCHNRTVIRRAKKLGIPSGKPLSDKDKERIASLNYGSWPRYTKIKAHRVDCVRCGHHWITRQHRPLMCPKCKSLSWDRPKRAYRGGNIIY